MPRRGIVSGLIYAFARAIAGGRHRHRVRHAKQATPAWKVSDGALRARLPSDADFVAKMKAIAASSGGAVQVLEPSRRKTRPDKYSITTRSEPGSLHGFVPFVSADAHIDGVAYGFHAYAHPTANAYSRFWLYFSVSGPAREGGKHGEFQITDEFRWTGDRPLNPLLVKFVLREWVTRPEVVAAVQRARATLPIPKKRVEEHS